MIIKSPSKRVSHLNLKFLDLKILSIQPQLYSETAPLPDCHNTSLPNIHRNSRNNQNSIIQLSDPGHSIHKSQTNNNSKQKFIYKPSIKYSSHCEQLTNDITIDNQGLTTSILDENAQNQQMNTESIMKYIAVDSHAIYDQLNKKLIQKYNVKNDGQQCKNSDIIDNKIQKYKEQIRNMQQQNSMIHQQICKIHANKLNEQNQQTKKVSNMRIFQHIKDQNTQKTNTVKQHVDQLTSVFKYQSENKGNIKRNFYDQFQKTSQQYQKTEQNKNNKGSKKNQSLRQRRNQMMNSIKSLKLQQGTKKQKKIKNSSQENVSKVLEKPKYRFNEAEFSLPSLIKNKYEHFYQDLYKQKYQKPVNQNSNKQQDIQRLNDLKKKLSNNNFDRNFQAFLQNRKIRVPQLFKNLR